MQDSTSEVLALIWHGTVLDSSMEDNNISRLSGHLDGVSEKILNIIRISGLDVGVWTHSGTAIFGGEFSQQGHKLKG